VDHNCNLIMLSNRCFMLLFRGFTVVDDHLYSRLVLDRLPIAWAVILFNIL
jgi:hypothetical protein